MQYKIRKGLPQAMENPTASRDIRIIAAEMIFVCLMSRGSMEQLQQKIYYLLSGDVHRGSTHWH
jgi:DNA polymerase II small subunit/DNA polymerase delta subunit B